MTNKGAKLFSVLYTLMSKGYLVHFVSKTHDFADLFCRLSVGAVVYLLDFFCSSIQFNLLLSTYLCFISFLYLDLYFLGDGALIS